MPVSSILDSTSFSALGVAGQKAVRDLFDKTYQSADRLAIDYPVLFGQQKSLSVSLNFFSNKLDKINPASFKFLRSFQRDALEQELLFAFYIFSAQYQLDEAEHRRQGLPARSEQIKKCACLINALRKSATAETPETMLACATNDDSERHAKYLGLTIVAPFIAEKMLDLSAVHTDQAEEWSGAGKTGIIKEWMGEVNGRRLYWVWGGGLLSTVISMLPDDFANKQQAQTAVAAPSPITGYMSWILYYTRFGINLSLLFKHTFAGPWMSQAERQIPAWERFKTQWQQRKFALLNDSIWGLANMACFFWLTGGGTLGYLGNVATTALLLMDVGLTVWRFYEESTQHNLDIQRYERDIRELRAKMKALAEEDEDKKIMLLQLTALEKAKKQCELDWQYKKYGLVNDLVYATSLMAAFSLMCCFLFPPAAIVPATALVLGVVGAVLCFVLTVAYAAVSGGLDITKSRATRHMVKSECQELLQQFKTTDDPFVKKQLYLDMKQLMTDSDYQERLIHFQKLKLARALLIDVMIPPLMFVTLMFMPLGIGLAVLVAGVALAFISTMILNRFAPEAAQLPELNEKEYTEFASLAEPTLDYLKDHKKTSGFFSNSTSSESKSQAEPTFEDELEEDNPFANFA